MCFARQYYERHARYPVRSGSTPQYGASGVCVHPNVAWVCTRVCFGPLECGRFDVMLGMDIE